MYFLKVLLQLFYLFFLFIYFLFFFNLFILSNSDDHSREECAGLQHGAEGEVPAHARNQKNRPPQTRAQGHPGCGQGALQNTDLPGQEVSAFILIG